MARKSEGSSRISVTEVDGDQNLPWECHFRVEFPSRGYKLKITVPKKEIITSRVTFEISTELLESCVSRLGNLYCEINPKWMRSVETTVNSHLSSEIKERFSIKENHYGIPPAEESTEFRLPKLSINDDGRLFLGFYTLNKIWSLFIWADAAESISRCGERVGYSRWDDLIEKTSWKPESQRIEDSIGATAGMSNSSQNILVTGKLFCMQMKGNIMIMWNSEMDQGLHEGSKELQYAPRITRAVAWGHDHAVSDPALRRRFFRMVSINCCVAGYHVSSDLDRLFQN